MAELVATQVQRLLRDWLHAGRCQVAAYLARNGHDLDPRTVAAACPALAGLPEGPAVARWHLAQLAAQTPGDAPVERRMEHA